MTQESSTHLSRTLYNQILDWLRRFVVPKYGGVQKTAEALGVSRTSFGRALTERTVPNAADFLAWAEAEGATVHLPTHDFFEASGYGPRQPQIDLCNVCSVGELELEPSKYIALPIVEDQCFFKGYIGEKDIKDHILFNKSLLTRSKKKTA